MASDLIKAVRSLKNLEHAWSVIQRNGRTSKSEEVRLELEAFAEDAPSKLRSLKVRLGRGSFKFEPAKGIPIPKLDGSGKKTGKFRPIVLAPVESRIVQRAILNVLLEVPDLKPFIQTRYSFGGIRGERARAKERLIDQILFRRYLLPYARFSMKSAAAPASSPALISDPFLLAFRKMPFRRSSLLL